MAASIKSKGIINGQKNGEQRLLAAVGERNVGIYLDNISVSSASIGIAANRQTWQRKIGSYRRKMARTTPCSHIRRANLKHQN